MSMSNEQLFFLLAVLALSLALVLVLTVPRLRRRSTISRGSDPRQEPAEGLRREARPGASLQAPRLRESAGSGHRAEASPRPAAAAQLTGAAPARSGLAAEPERAGAGARVREPGAPLEATHVAAGPGSGAGRGRVCQACQRQYPTGFQFCPVDARPLGDAEMGPAGPGPALKRLRCGGCRRQFLADDGARFCPFDGQRLESGRDQGDDLAASAEGRVGLGVVRSGRAVRLTRSSAREAGPAKFHSSHSSAGPTGTEDPNPPVGIFAVGPPPVPGNHIPTKICPTCSDRIHTSATQCPRDGAELVSLN
jgi:hypothetical protein